MAKKLLFLPLLVISLLFISPEAYSDVLIEDSREATIGGNNTINVTSGNIETGDGEEGNYVIIACANDFTNGLNFDPPNPLSWTELDEGSCIGLNSALCGHAIWGTFVSDPISQTITCGWNPATVLYVAGSMRYTNVDPDDPIIDVECGAGFGDTATAPSIVTEAGSQVLRVITSGQSTITGTLTDISSRAEEIDSFNAIAASTEFNRILIIAGVSVLFEDNGPTGPALFPLGPLTGWRACTIGIRMAPLERNVPTMSEWGLVGFAAFAGIAGVWYLRRKQVTA